MKIDGRNLDSELLAELAKNPNIKLSVPKEQIENIKLSRSLLEDAVKEGRIIYGVNTSMGGFVNWLVPINKAAELQSNLISSVASNVGPYFSDIEVRSAMIARLNSLAKGNSAISLKNFNILLGMINNNVIPCIPQYGSLGASGDLGPLACIALVGCGKWRAKYNNQIVSGHQAMRSAGLNCMELSFKEGLALINGTSAMTGIASLLVTEIKEIIDKYILISSLSCEALYARIKPFSPYVHSIKNHSGQEYVAARIFEVLSESKMVINEEEIERRINLHQNDTVRETLEPIEDAYSIRCTPQILGPAVDTSQFAKKIIDEELNSSNDNPIVDFHSNDIIHNGNFHGQYISMVMDYLNISLATIANLSDRRIDRLLDKSNSSGLPPFLCKDNPGLRLGLMGLQFCSTSLTAEIRSLLTPISIQTLTSTADFQDHVSLGLVAARRVNDIIERIYPILAIELICACQAVEIRGIDRLSSTTLDIFKKVRMKIPFFENDDIMTDYIENVVSLIREIEFSL